MKKKILSERQKELLDMALKVIDEWKRTGDVTPPFFF